MPAPDQHIALTLGVLLAAALFAGVVAERLRLPKVTAYLLVGLLLGPYTLESLPDRLFDFVPKNLFAITTISESALHRLEPVAKFAIALVLFNMGCSLTLKEVRSNYRSILRLSLGELSLTFLLVAVGLPLLGESWPRALLFGALALATAPATTVLVLKENRSEGPLTRYANTLVVLNNVASIVIFEVLFLAILVVRHELPAPLVASVARLCLEFIGSVSGGILAGLAVSLGCAVLARSRWLVMLIAVSTAMLGLCEHYGLPYLLTFLVMGATVANTSDRGRDIVAQLDQLTGLLCVVFFVIHGTGMDLRALLAAGTIGMGYIVLRLTGKYFGIFLTSRRHEGLAVKRWLGATLMAQAGAAIALSEIAAQRFPALGEPLQDVILGTVVVFEIGGPILIRQAVIRAGEAPLDTVILHQETTIYDEIRALGTRLLAACGIEPGKRVELKSLTVGDLMQRNVVGIPSSATFARVVEFIEHSHDNMLPVVDDQNAVVGMIDYRDLQDEHFDPGLGALVRAADLALTSFPCLHEDDPAMDGWREFQQSKVDCLPVASRDRPRRLLGILRRRDLEQFVTPGNGPP